MPTKDVVLIVSPSHIACDQLCGLLETQPAIELRRLVLGGASADEMAGSQPRLVVLDLGEHPAQSLSDWNLHTRLQRVPMIVVGPANDSTVMRRAMQGGARDYFTRPLQPDELGASVRQVLRETAPAGDKPVGGRLTAVINAKGGSGASLIACNVAHILAARNGRSTALIDMDLQFGALPLALDLKVRESMIDVIAAADRLDPVALKGYMTLHSSGLAVLGAMTDQLAFPAEIPVEAVQTVLDVALQTFEHVVVDLPKQIDALTGMVLRRADRILVPLQQSIAHLRDAKRMYTLLLNYLGVPKDRVSLVLNRYSDKNAVSVEDIDQAIQPSALLTVPNDFYHVSEALNLGVPLYQGARTAPVTESLCALAAHVEGSAEAPAAESGTRSRLKRVFGFAGARA
ncbi:MAG TPA: AAA family ATPase [Nevskiaceae bacterium]|nr:AAA family ATPase [Nevskiaceae bacterium]